MFFLQRERIACFRRIFDDAWSIIIIISCLRQHNIGIATFRCAFFYSFLPFFCLCPNEICVEKRLPYSWYSENDWKIMRIISLLLYIQFNVSQFERFGHATLFSLVVIGHDRTFFFVSMRMIFICSDAEMKIYVYFQFSIIFFSNQIIISLVLIFFFFFSTTWLNVEWITADYGIFFSF